MNQVSSGPIESVSTESQSHSERQTDRVIDYLFLSLSAKYGHRWGSQFTSDDKARVIKGEWARGLAGLDAQQMRKGLDRCIHDYPDWPPAVGQFLALCQVTADEAGLPSMVEAWDQICREDREFTHGVVFAMRRDRGCAWGDWRLLPQERALKLFEPIYRQYVERALGGEKFELPVVIEDRRARPVTWDERKRHAEGHLAAMRALLG